MPRVHLGGTLITASTILAVLAALAACDVIHFAGDLARVGLDSFQAVVISPRNICATPSANGRTSKRFYH